MGTRGLRIIRFRGRYFVYYNNWDSYLEGLGKDLVSGIPTDVEQYKAWLESEREKYAIILAKLETQVLTVTEDQMQQLVAAKDNDGGQREWDLYWRKSDYGIEELPTAFCDIGTNLWIEWTYLVDLDRELFAINTWIYFELADIPRDRWIEAFKQDDEGRLVFSFETAPEGWEGLWPPDYFEDVGDDVDEFRVAFRQYHSSMVDVKKIFSPTIQRIIAIVVFSQLSNPDESEFPPTLSGLGCNELAFRELAFAILSLAAGSFFFDKPRRFLGNCRREKSKGYLVDRDGRDGLQLMPLFGSGCHLENQEPGSAPISSIYWFEGVLISLVPYTVFRKDTEAAIAKVVAFGLAESRRNFQAVLFSIFKAVFLDVCVVDGVEKVRRTQAVCIFGVGSTEIVASGQDISNDSGPEFDSPLAKICRKHPGFISLQNFFTTAANRRLSVFGQGLFPVEIYAKIIANADASTRHSCSKVSQIFNELCQKQFSFSDNLTILHMEDPACPPRFQDHQRRRWFAPADLGAFIFKDETTGTIVRSKLNGNEAVRTADREKMTTWSPVIGNMERPSMLTQLELRLWLQG